MTVETDAGGRQKTRFIPVPAIQTPSALEAMCNRFEEVRKENQISRLLLIPMFILDFLCIHPFHDGNGRMSRLLTLLLLYKGGFVVGKYVSLERLIEKSKATYYEALQSSWAGWHENANRYAPFVKYCLGILIRACSEFENRIEPIRDPLPSRQDRIRIAIDQTIGKITKKDLMERCPDISKTTIECTLSALLKSGQIVKTGQGLPQDI